MAPEVVVMLKQVNYEKVGYTHMVDWWSFGCTVFKFLTGERAFEKDNQSGELVDMNAKLHDMYMQYCDDSEFAMLFHEIQFPDHVSSTAKDLITKLCNVDEELRLGAAKGVKEIQSHPFFKGTDWALLEQKHIEAPYKPPPSKLFSDTLVATDNFETFMEGAGRKEWLDEVRAPNTSENLYFKNW